MTVHQIFYGTLPTLEVVDVLFTPPPTGIPELRVHEGTVDGPVLAVSRNFMLGAGPHGRTRVALSNALPVVVNAPYYFELRMAVQPDFFWHSGNFGEVSYPPAGLDQCFISGMLDEHMALDFGAGVFIPQILPDDARALTYWEHQGDVFVFPQAHFTNDYVTNYASATLRMSGPFAENAGGLRVSGTVSNVVYFNSVAVGAVDPGYIYPSPLITFNSNATAAAVQSVLRQVVYGNYSCNPSVDPVAISFALTTAQGITEESVSLQVVATNDPPGVDIGGGGYRDFPGSERPVAVAATRQGADVYLNGEESHDCEGDGPLSYSWTSLEQPGWSSSETNLTHRFALGVNHVTLQVSGGGLTGEKTILVEVIRTGEAVRRLKKSVRANASGRERLELLRYLSHAQTALSFGHERVAILNLQRFQHAVLVTYPITSDLIYSWSVAAAQIESAIAP